MPRGSSRAYRLPGIALPSELGAAAYLLKQSQPLPAAYGGHWTNDCFPSSLSWPVVDIFVFERQAKCCNWKPDTFTTCFMLRAFPASLPQGIPWLRNWKLFLPSLLVNAVCHTFAKALCITHFALRAVFQVIWADIRAKYTLLSWE